MPTLTMRDLLEAGIHFGHQTRRWNPRMGPYIFGQRNGIYIIDLQKTVRQLKIAYTCVRDAVANGGTVLFVGTKKQARDTVVREAQRCGMYYVNNRWLGGTLTNWKTIRQSIKTLARLQEMDESGKLDEMFKKKEAIRLRKRAAKLETNLGGIKDIPGLPDVVFVVDAKKEAIAVREAARAGIPCIAIVDTNADPNLVPIPIPGNDDAIRAIALFCKVISDAVLEGKMQADKVAPEAQERKGRPRAEVNEVQAAQAQEAAQRAAQEAAQEAAQADVEEPATDESAETEKDVETDEGEAEAVEEVEEETEEEAEKELSEEE